MICFINTPPRRPAVAAAFARRLIVTAVVIALAILVAPVCRAQQSPPVTAETAKLFSSGPTPDGWTPQDEAAYEADVVRVSQQPMEKKLKLLRKLQASPGGRDFWLTMKAQGQSQVQP